MAEEVPDLAEVDDNGEIVSERHIYTCKFCDKSFNTWQAYGGHQNGHRRERTAMKQLQKDADAISMRYPPPPPLFLDRPPFVSLVELARRAYLQTPVYNPYSLREPRYFPRSQPASSSHLWPFFRSFNAGSSAALSANAHARYAPYELGGGPRRGEEWRKRFGNYEHGSTSRTAGPAASEAAAVAAAGPPSLEPVKLCAEEKDENGLDLSLHL